MCRNTPDFVWIFVAHWDLRRTTTDDRRRQSEIADLGRAAWKLCALASTLVGIVAVTYGCIAAPRETKQHVTAGNETESDPIWYAHEIHLKLCFVSRIHGQRMASCSHSRKCTVQSWV